MNQKVSKALRITLASVCAFGAVLLLGFATINIVQYAYYQEYQSVRTDVVLNYGLNKPFATQGLEYVPSIDTYITSSYSDKKDQASAIFVSDDDYFNIINRDGSIHKGHVGGIAIHEESDRLFISDNKGLSVVRLSELTANYKKPDKLHIIENHNFEIYTTGTSFVFVDGDFLYTGEFYNEKPYAASGYRFEYKNQLSCALVTKYAIDDLNTPLSYIAVPDKVQGLAFKDGFIYLSTSYALANSHIFTYNLDKAIEDGAVIDYAFGADMERKSVVFLGSDHLVHDLTAPCMTEDMTIATVNGKPQLITHFESASTKYIIGKFYFQNYIVALDILR